MMKTLVNKINQLKKTKIKQTVDKRIRQFEANKQCFSELCFCLLTANSKAETAINIQKQLGHKGFCTLCLSELANCIKKNKHRFHNTKARYILEARKFMNIKNILKNKSSKEAREWLVKNIKGLGYKEASHFLRNVGYKDLAIIDRHIISILLHYKIIREKTINKTTYLNIEQKLANIAEKANLTQAELDLYLWYMKTGKVLK